MSPGLSGSQGPQAVLSRAEEFWSQRPGSQWQRLTGGAPTLRKSKMLHSSHRLAWPLPGIDPQVLLGSAGSCRRTLHHQPGPRQALRLTANAPSLGLNFLTA